MTLDDGLSVLAVHLVESREPLRSLALLALKLGQGRDLVDLLELAALEQDLLLLLLLLPIFK